MAPRLGTRAGGGAAALGHAGHDANPARPGLPPFTDLTGADDYMTGLTAFAQPIVPGTVRELAGVGDDHNALLALDLRAAFDPSGPAVPGSTARIPIPARPRTGLHPHGTL